MKRKLKFIILGLFFGVFIVSVYSTLAASNIVQTTGLSETNNAVLVSELTPPECAGLTLTNLVYAPSDGTNANDLILGTAGDDTFNGKNGNDCIVGGGGNDNLDGGPGDDILLGGDGDDILDGRGGNDTCDGGSGTNTIVRCE